MPTTTITHTTQEVPGRGFQKRALILDLRTGQPICQRIGGVPYAIPLDASQRWRQARPLPKDFHYGTSERPADFTGLANDSPQPASSHDMPRQDEDCLQMNIYVPEGRKPEGGWPVFFYIYGGFLQWGSPNLEDPISLYQHTPFRAIFVAPTYRLNAFGFLASTELLSESTASSDAKSPPIVGNLGFWDQRLALEFTAAEIASYGGDPNNITVGGLSAGAYSTFHQLAYSLSLPSDRAHIRRVVMWSNGCGLQPKPISEVQSHFDALVSALDIPKSLSAKEKLARLRSVPWRSIAKAVDKVPINAFRAVTDGVFVRRSLFAELHSGSFGRQLRDRGIQVLAGDVRDEFNSYRAVSPPGSYAELVRRLAVEYPLAASEKLARIYCPDGKLPKGYETWQDVFGRIYADVQVHATQRGFLSCLVPVLPASQVFRYRVEARAKCIDGVMPPEMGVCHGSDLGYWFWGHCFSIGGGLTEKEARVAAELVGPLWRYVQGKREEVGWGTKGIEEVRKVEEGGNRVVVAKDHLWDAGLRVWNGVHGISKARL